MKQEYIKSYSTGIDDFGDRDGIRIVICRYCGDPSPDKNNMESWNKCINIKETEAYSEIMEIGIEGYALKVKRNAQ